MTSTLAQGAGRIHGEPVRPLRALAASPALIVLLLVGLALRLTIAYVLFPSSGFQTDIDSYVSWALTMGQHGPGGFYANAGFIDYPPGYLYLLWPIGVLASGSQDAVGTATGLIKLPAILIDLAVGYVIYRLVLGWAWPGRRAESLALVAAALYVFNPVSFYDSALWGQTDAAGALVVLLGVAALVRGNSEGAAALAAAAAVVKPQFGVVLIPLFGIVLLKRHLFRPGSGPRHPAWAPAQLSAWLARVQGWPRLLTSAAAALAVFFALALPFGLDIGRYLELMTRTAGGYTWLSVNAFNMWALVGSDGTPPLAESFLWSSDTVPLLGPLPALVIGSALLIAGYLWAVFRAAARDDRWTLLVAVTFMAIAFFILPTRVHERYLFPAVALLPILAVVSGRWALALLLVSIGAFINLHAILTISSYGTENVTSLPFGELFRSNGFIVASAVLQTTVGLWAAWQLRPSLATSPDGFQREANAGSRGIGPAAVAAGPPSPMGPPGWSARQGGPYPAPMEDPSPDGWVSGPSALDSVVARFTRPPLRSDHSRELAGEPRGRLDRRDLLVFLVVVIAAIVTRGFNLERPYSMYFDEVYHARTATEFLQRWEYGQSHDIYEFTHPHLAKYAMAWGIRLAGGNHVNDTRSLGVPVEDAALERRWSETPESDVRNGDRLYVGTGTELRVYDLATREQVEALPIEATALAVDALDHQLFIADRTGAILVLDTVALDERRHGTGEPGGLEVFAGGTGQAIDDIVVTDDSVVTLSPEGLASYDRYTGRPRAQLRMTGIADAVALPWAERIVADGSSMGRPAAAARLLADLLDDDAGRIEGLLASGQPEIVLGAWPDETERGSITDALDAGELSGVRLEGGPLLAVAGRDGIEVLDATTLDVVEPELSSRPTTALVVVERGLGDPTLYSASGEVVQSVRFDDEGPRPARTVTMPGPVRDIAWNEPSNLVHVLGESVSGGPTIYVIEPNGNAVFIDVPMPVEPEHLLMDTQPERPFDDRGELLALASDGTVVDVEISRNAFGWRLPGLLLAALAAGLLYLLARLLFARRSVGLIAAILILAEGMFFANGRIAMNDVYVTTFIIIAALLFTSLYLARRRPWTTAAALLGAGLALGLALASKWVALFAIGGLVLLVLLRSGLGRVVALVGMVGLTSVLGAIAIRPGAALGDDVRNWSFLAIMMVLTALLAAAMVRRPLAIGRGEVWLAGVGPILLGGALLVMGFRAGPDPELPLDLDRLTIGGVLAIAIGMAAFIVAWLVARFGLGPFAKRVKRDQGPPLGWQQPGWLAGLPWLLALAVLVLVPVGVYILSYAPWVDLGNQWGLPWLDSVPFLPAGGDGQTLPELTRSMYEYHDNLRAQHAASSPWWAWPLDLKPVWFYQERFAGPTTGLIYDAGNLVVFWLGLPAMAFAAWAAWRRRSLSLTVVVLLFAAMWLPWARIDRATFQYHFYASLPFVILALAYLLAELWHGPGPRTWFLARMAAAAAILAMPVLWLLRTPLCIVAGTATAHPDGVACAAEVDRTVHVSEALIGVSIVVLVGAAAALLIAWWASKLPPEPYPDADRKRALAAVGLVLVGIATLVGVALSIAALDQASPTTLTLSSDLLALLALALAAIPATMAFRARDARRFVIGVLAAAVLWFIIWYPNISGLPLPSDLAHVYQGLLPTWNWDFQFAVNLSEPVEGGSLGELMLVVAVGTVALVVGTAIAAALWGRSAMASGSDCSAPSAPGGAPLPGVAPTAPGPTRPPARH